MRGGTALLTSKSSGMVLLVRLYAHYAKASFLHKFTQTVPSTDHCVKWIFSMYDWYEPEPPFTCAETGEVLRRWQGKDAECLMLLWRQNIKSPIEHVVPLECQMDKIVMKDICLPNEFVIYAENSKDKLFFATGICKDGIWVETRF